MNIDLTAPKFHDENMARKWFEMSRWPNGVSCIHCGSVRADRMGGTKHRAGLFHCPDCRGQFTVRTGHVMESSKVPVDLGLFGPFLLLIRFRREAASQFLRSSLYLFVGRFIRHTASLTCRSGAYVIITSVA